VRARKLIYLLLCVGLLGLMATPVQAHGTGWPPHEVGNGFCLTTGDGNKHIIAPRPSFVRSWSGNVDRMWYRIVFRIFAWNGSRWVFIGDAHKPWHTTVAAWAYNNTNWYRDGQVDNRDDAWLQNTGGRNLIEAWWVFSWANGQKHVQFGNDCQN